MIMKHGRNLIGWHTNSVKQSADSKRKVIVVERCRESTNYCVTGGITVITKKIEDGTHKEGDS